MEEIKCHLCSAALEKDHVALNKKLLDRNMTDFFCLDCLAKYLSSTKETLLQNIIEFKERGCGLFK